jgi:WD40 repeat protein
MAPVEVSPRVTIDTGFPTQTAGRETYLFGLSVSADGKRVALCSQDDGPNVQVWDVDGPKKVDECRTGNLKGQVALTPDGSAVLRRGFLSGMTVRLVGGQDRPWPDTGGTGEHFVLSPAGDRLAVSTFPDVEVWDVASMKRIFAKPADTPDHFPALSNFFDGGAKVATVDHKGVVTVWEAASGNVVKTFETNPQKPGFVNSVLWASPDGKYIAGQPGPVVVWDVATGRVVRELPRDIAGFAGARLIFLTGDRLAVAMKDNAIAVTDVASGRTTAVLKGHAGPVASLAVTPDGKTLVSGDMKGKVLVWDLP